MEDIPLTRQRIDEFPKIVERYLDKNITDKTRVWLLKNLVGICEMAKTTCRYTE